MEIAVEAIMAQFDIEFFNDVFDNE